MHAIETPRLYAITDSRLMPGNRLYDCVEQALKGGCRWVQYRNKSTDSRKRLAEAKQLRDLCQYHQANLIINDNPMLAKACAAQGVHLGQEDMPIAEARALLGSQAIIGITCHDSLQLAREGEAAGANYVAFGRFFSSSTKPNASAAPITLIAQAKTELKSPIVVIGGITLRNAPQLLSAGAHCLAVCEGLFGAQDIESQAAAFIALNP